LHFCFLIVILVALVVVSFYIQLSFLKIKKHLKTCIMGERTKLCDYTNTPNEHFIARPITTPDIQANSFEVIPSLLNLITREQFGGSAQEDASMHLHDFIKICDMQKFKNVENDVLKLKLFLFSLR
jgi:hypothetical protein